MIYSFRRRHQIGPCHRPHLSPRKPGIHSQFPEVCPGAHPEDRFPGLLSRLSLELRLPADKIKKIVSDLWRMLSDNCKEASTGAGQAQCSNQGHPPLAQLFYRNLQRALASALGKSGQDYLSSLRFSKDEREEFQWWIDHLSTWNGR